MLRTFPEMVTSASANQRMFFSQRVKSVTYAVEFLDLVQDRILIDAAQLPESLRRDNFR